MEQKQRTATTAEREEVEIEETPNVPSAEEVLEGADCCLADIDEVLGDNELDKARRDAQEVIDAYNRAELTDDEARNRISVFNATYAHLPMRMGQSCCGEPYLFDPTSD